LENRVALGFPGLDGIDLRGRILRILQKGKQAGQTALRGADIRLGFLAEREPVLSLMTLPRGGREGMNQPHGHAEDKE